jgi:hypothetical protein
VSPGASGNVSSRTHLHDHFSAYRMGCFGSEDLAIVMLWLAQLKIDKEIFKDFLHLRGICLSMYASLEEF